MGRSSYRHVRVQDPVTGEYYWDTEKYEKPTLDEETRISLVGEVLSGKRTVEDIQKEYDLTSITSVYSWIGKYVSQNSSLSLPENEEDMAKDTSEQRLQELEAENKRLSKALELEKIRSEAYNTMIDLAEKTFNIPVRKKSGTKR